MIDTPLPDVVPKPDRFIGMRHIIATLLFLATTVSYATRVSMSVTIVAMTSNSSTNSNSFPKEAAKHIGEKDLTQSHASARRCAHPNLMLLRVTAGA